MGLTPRWDEFWTVWVRLTTHLALLVYKISYFARTRAVRNGPGTR